MSIMRALTTSLLLSAMISMCMADDNILQPTVRPYPRPRRAEYNTEPQYPPAKYSYSWSVQDDYSQNNYGQEESRDGDETSGSYYVALPDGRTQRVTYSVKPDTGYQAVVTYEGEVIKATPAENARSSYRYKQEQQPQQQRSIQRSPVPVSNYIQPEIQQTAASRNVQRQPQQQASYYTTEDSRGLRRQPKIFRYAPNALVYDNKLSDDKKEAREDDVEQEAKKNVYVIAPTTVEPRYRSSFTTEKVVPTTTTTTTTTTEKTPEESNDPKEVTEPANDSALEEDKESTSTVVDMPEKESEVEIAVVPKKVMKIKAIKTINKRKGKPTITATSRPGRVYYKPAPKTLLERPSKFYYKDI